MIQMSILSTFHLAILISYHIVANDIDSVQSSQINGSPAFVLVISRIYPIVFTEIIKHAFGSKVIWS